MNLINTISAGIEKAAPYIIPIVCTIGALGLEYLDNRMKTEFDAGEYIYNLSRVNNDTVIQQTENNIVYDMYGNVIHLDKLASFQVFKNGMVLENLFLTDKEYRDYYDMIYPVFYRS